MSYYNFPKYVSVAEKRAKAEKKIKQLKKENPHLKPVIIEGKAIAKTWWGKEWNKNLERYADYANRIGRGRSYVRHMAVLDLQIKQGEVTSLVQGSYSKPYTINIKIDAIPQNNWASIKEECKGRLDSIKKLLGGKFSKSFSDMFTARNKGLFPTPYEIHFSCSCPDWAYMCKHVAATLYGIGARLDEDPTLFFKLRKVSVNDLVSQVVEDSAKDLLKKAKKKTKRVLDDTNLSDIFGIDLTEKTFIEDFSSSPAKKMHAKKSTPAKKKRKNTKTVKKSAVKQKEKAQSPKKKTVSSSIKTSSDKKRLKNAKQDIPAIDAIEKIIKTSKKGIGIPELSQKSGFEPTKIRNIVFRLKQKGKIRNISRGIYLK